MKKYINRDFIKFFLLLTLGAYITSFSLIVFSQPNKIVGGGLSGISTILYHLLSIPTSVTFFVGNFVFLSAAFFVLGKRFVLDSLLGASLVTLFMEINSYLPKFTGDLFLGAAFGSLLYGVGIGITLVVGANSGGTDILGRLLQHYIPHLPIGKTLLVIDGIIILTSLCLFKNVQLTLYGILSLILSTFTIDFLVSYLNSSKLAMVITSKGEEIADLLISTSPRGVTQINVKGAYSKEGKTLLLCALKAKELQAFQEKILSVDETSFIIFCESQKIMGNGFYIYK